ncbi:MAG: FAD-binding oxidoreductase [Chitinophagaceae bacterium]|nr:FAD-binding oxidoreductase [Chitinophagaceae bacterium]
MQISVWEKESFFAPCDVAIAGSGFVGLWSAYYLKKKQPDLRVTIIDRGIIPTGASTRNAGFACYGSVTELVKDAETMGEDNMLNLVEMRYRGIRRIQKLFDEKEIDFKNFGGYELISNHNYKLLFEEVKWLNKLLRPIFSSKNTFRFANEKINEFGFEGIRHLIHTKPEEQLHSGKLCLKLLQLVQSMGVTVISGAEVKYYENSANGVRVFADKFSIQAGKLLICTNAFAMHLLPGLDIVPARGQILVTEPIPSLKIKGAFHFDEGFYYFRNLGNRLLLGGARNSAIEEETTDRMDISDNIQLRLEEFLTRHLLPGKKPQITDRWSGIMGMGTEVMPIVKELLPGVFCAVRMGGMGVALAPLAGDQVSDMMIG